MEKVLQHKAPQQLKSENAVGGKSVMPPSFGLQAGPIQRVEGDVPGRGQCTEIGDFWIVPDNTKVCYANVVGEQITETEYAAMMATWSAIKGGTGNLTISEKDGSGVEHAGFKIATQAQLAKLMSKPLGRGLLASIVNGGKMVTIRPSDAQIYGGANAIRGGAGTLENADGSAGAGGTTIIQIDANLKDTDIMVNDAAGKEISDPVFIILGHELIHAKHNAEGRNRRGQAASSADYSNKEEEETISTGSLTEKGLRTEHGLGVRYGHAGRDTR